VNPGFSFYFTLMTFVPVWSYDNYVPAHVAMGRLNEEGFDCWLKDENTVTIDPILTNAIGGIKLMVAEDQAAKAWELLNGLRLAHKKTISCPNCGSHNLELVSTPRKPLTWFSAIFTFLLGDYALTLEKVYHCFDCKHEFPESSVEPGTDNRNHD
jgi:DNA-directed RNA polymerase subunit RPC12/RpoP